MTTYYTPEEVADILKAVSYTHLKQHTYHCAECGAAFVPNSNRQKYCPSSFSYTHLDVYKRQNIY